MIRNRIAALLFFCAAFALSAMWFVFLFVAQPQGVPTATAAAHAALFALTQSPAPWFFALMAICPLVLVALALAAWHVPAGAWRFPSRLGFLAMAGTVMVMVVLWEASFFAGAATYLLLTGRDG